MRNEYPGRCIRCDAQVKAKQGYFELANDSNKKLRQLRRHTGRWVLRCKECVGKGNEVPV